MFPQQESLFFENPWHYRKPPGLYGVLFLLRRDINSCLGTETGLHHRSPRQIQWPGVMGIFAGIDLLAKFLAGEDGEGVGNRFRAFVTRYFRLSDGDVEAIYQLRNSMLHSFGLYSRLRNGTVYRFRLESAGAGLLVRKTSPEHFVVDVISLHELFERAIEDYRKELQNDAPLQHNFLAMFPNYGSIHIG